MQVDKNQAIELNAGRNNRKYKIEAIYDNMIFAKELKSGYVLDLYYLVS